MTNDDPIEKMLVMLDLVAGPSAYPAYRCGVTLRRETLEELVMIPRSPLGSVLGIEEVDFFKILRLALLGAVSSEDEIRSEFSLAEAQQGAALLQRVHEDRTLAPIHV